MFGDAMERLGIRYLSLTSTSVETLEDQIQELQPLVLLTNVESLNDSGIQRKISKLKLSYIAIDKAQVFCRSMTAAESLSIFTQPTSLKEGTDLNLKNNHMLHSFIYFVNLCSSLLQNI